MNKKRVKAMLGIVTAFCVAFTIVPNSFVFAQENTNVITTNEENVVANTSEEIKETSEESRTENIAEENAKSVTIEESTSETELNFSEGTTVYYNGNYYTTLIEALKGVYMDTETTGVKEIHCKEGADVGVMTHGHVADDLIIHGNGAYVSGGERDLEIDTYKYDRTTGNQAAAGYGSYLDKDITVTVNNLNGIAAWGQRHTSHTVTLNFINCENMQRIYFTGQTGDININVDNCTFDSESETLKANKDTTIYSNANGAINVNNSIFNNIDVPLNLNHKMKGTQTIVITNTEFINCAQGSDSNKEYAAPVRIVAQQNAVSNLSIENSKFTYSDGISNCGNGDILLGDGRSGESAVGTTTLSMSNTKAAVMVQKAGYHSNGTTNPDKATTTEVEVSDVVFTDDKNHFDVDKHDEFTVVNQKDSSCSEEGYTGDKVCTKCGKELEKGQVIKKLEHSYDSELKSDEENHWKECTVCHEKENIEKHAFKWVVDKEPTEKEKGSKHEECSVCGYKKASVEIPVVTPTNPEKPNTDKPNTDKQNSDKSSPKTGDQTNIGLSNILLTMSGLGIAVLAVLKKKQALDHK